MQLRLTLLFLFGMPLWLFSQNAVNIFVMDMAFSENDGFSISNPKWITADNRDGYNSQPVFIDSIMFITAQRDGQQTDIFAFDIDKRIRYQMTDTPESEYSPTPMPDDRSFSVVRVSADSFQYQQLWKISYNLTRPPVKIMDKVFNVGYQCWLDESSIMLFIVGNPRHRLNIYDIWLQTFKPVSSSIGRCLKISPKGKPCFVDKVLDDKWFIKEYDPETKTFTTIAETLPGSEDYEFTPDGYLLMGKGRILYSLKVYEEYNWKPIADLGHWGINNINRIAYGNGRIAVVTN